MPDVDLLLSLAQPCHRPSPTGPRAISTMSGYYKDYPNKATTTRNMNYPNNTNTTDQTENFFHVKSKAEEIVFTSTTFVNSGFICLNFC